MILKNFAGRVLDSKHFRSLWQSSSFGFVVRFFPQSTKQHLKTLYRRILVTPTMILRTCANVDLWDHSKPILSVVIPCHNHGEYIREALLSLELQTFKDFETLIVDDGSNDDYTLRTLEYLRSQGVRVLHQDKLNVAAALNYGISVARGKYVCCFAADDRLEPTYFEKCLCLLEANPGVSFAYSLVRTFGDENRIWMTEQFDLRMLLEYNHVCATAVFVRAIWEQVGGFDATLDGYEDWDFWIKAGKAGFRGALIPEVLFNYRRHGMTLNRQSDRRSQRLIDHIKSNHAILFSHPGQIKKIQNHYRDITTPQPFLNISLKEQYNDSKKDTIVILASVRGLRAAALSLGETSLTSLSTRARVLFVSTDTTTYEMDESLRDLSDQAYFVSRFLDSRDWLAFVLNLIATRDAELVIISDSHSAYEWASAIRTRTSAKIVDILQDETDCRLSAQHDELIDLHVATTEYVHQLALRSFFIPRVKIRLLSGAYSRINSRNEPLAIARNYN